MLVLTRKVGEGIIIGDAIKIYVLDIGKGQVRIGIEAPTTTSVHRQEIYLRIQEENIKAAATPLDNLDQVEDIWRKKQKA